MTELLLGDVELAVAEEARGLGPAAHRTREGGELHAARGHARVVPVNGHDAVRDRQDRGDALAAAARGHGIDHEAVETDVLYLLPGGFVDELVGPLELAVPCIEDLPF